MKKVTSAALLAIRLTWKTVLAVLLAAAGCQVFFVFRELMPGGVPLQTTFAFEELLRSAVQPAGKCWMVILLGFLAVKAGSTRGSKTVYTMNRLGLSENQMALVFGGVFTGYFLLYWALQLAAAYGVFVWYSRFSLINSNAWMLACWRSEWLHILLPLGEWWGYLRNLAICAGFGFSAAFGSCQLRRGKLPLAGLVPPLLCAVFLTGEIGAIALDASLTVLLTAFPIGYFFALRGGRKDEDL